MNSVHINNDVINVQTQSLFQFWASNFSTKLGRFAGFFHWLRSHSGHWSFPVGFRSHKRLKRACLAPSLSGNACKIKFWNKGPYFVSITTVCTEKRGNDAAVPGLGWTGPRAEDAVGEGVVGWSGFNFFAGGCKAASASFPGNSLRVAGVLTCSLCWAFNKASSACASLRDSSNSAWIKSQRKHVRFCCWEKLQYKLTVPKWWPDGSEQQHVLVVGKLPNHPDDWNIYNINRSMHIDDIVVVEVYHIDRFI